MTQSKALQVLKTGANVFLTGQPGSGKTYTINQYVKWLNDNRIVPSITASTGIAATHIGGVTIHSWSGIGINEALTDDQIEAIADQRWIRNKVGSAKVLIIDEVSMLPAHVLDLVDRVCRKAKLEKDLPFGGMQVILVGDFFQLPPVAKKGTKASFVFNSDAWKALDLKTCVLHEQHRQEDGVYLEVLTAMRNGALTPTHKKVLDGRIIVDGKGETRTRLFTHNGDVDALNTTELRKLPGDLESFGMEESGVPALIATLKKNCLSPEILKLKQSALVMFTRNNFEDGYVNGTLGQIEGFSNGLPMVRTQDGDLITPDYQEWSIKEGDRTIAAIRQIPLRLAWAITVHKSQGMSLDSAIIDLGAAFEYGQGYVALSRVRSLKGLFLEGLNDKALEMHPEVIVRDSEFLVDSEMLDEQIDAYPVDTLQKMENDFIKRSK